MIRAAGTRLGAGTSPAPSRRARTSRAILVACIIALVGVPALADPTDQATWIVVGRSPSQLSEALEAARIPTTTHAITAAPLRISAQLRDALARDPRIVAIERDRPVDIESEGSQVPAPWHLDRLDQRELPLSGSFNWTDDAAGVRAYVVDTGINATHVEFGGRVAAGYSVHGSTDDCHGHGTWVAGLIGGTTHGVAKEVQFVPVRTFDCDGSATISDILFGLDWVLTSHPVGSPAVVNLSFGTAGSIALDSAVSDLSAQGLTVTTSAGNQAGDACTRSPARSGHVITVGGTDEGDQLWPTSNSGPCVDVFAPGGWMLSASHQDDTTAVGRTGTSGAAALVSGAAARILGRPGWGGAGPDAIADVLIREATGILPSGAHDGSPEAFLHAPPVTPPRPPGERNGIAISGSGSWGGTSGTPGCVRTTGDEVLRAPLDVPEGVVVDRIIAEGRGAPGVLHVRTAGWIDGAPGTGTIATLITDRREATTSTSWPMRGTHDLIAEWSSAYGPAELCAIRVAFRTAPIPDDVRTFRVREPCVALDTRSGTEPPWPHRVDLQQICGVAPPDHRGVRLHVAVFPGHGGVRLWGDRPEWARIFAPATSRRSSTVVTVPTSTGDLWVDAPGRPVRIVVTSELGVLPVRPSPDWAQ